MPALPAWQPPGPVQLQALDGDGHRWRDVV